MKLIYHLLAATGIALASASVWADKPALTVYTYDSFVSDWGPGPIITKAFEATCGCQLKLVGLEDGAALLSRLKMEGKRSRADVILGLDTSLTGEATATGLLAPHGVELSQLDLAIDWSDKVFLPYDYGHFAFVYDSDRLTAPPTSLRALVNDANGPKIIIQDPRTSTPGLGFLLWMRQVFGNDTSEAWKKLAPRILTVTKGWSEAYGLFLEEEALMVLSYTTSPAYHRHVDKTERYRAAAFSEGHYAQIEVAAKVAHSPNQALADQFLAFMLSPEFQNIIPTTNWMYPATRSHTALPAAFNGLVSPKTTLLFDASVVARQRKIWIREWLDALTD